MLLLAYWFSLPNPLFKDPASMVLEDRDGNLLGARIATDGQWRFPESDSLPQKFIDAIVEFEDHRFFYHPGVDPIGFGRAIVQNIKNGRIVSGGSTISMQCIRMSQKNKKRTVWRKLIEIILATRLEIRYSKNKILNLYASHAPFGGNVVGLEAASWRYFAKKPHLLSWAEATAMAVLPNSPGLIHPGRNRQALFDKRNRLLDRLYEAGKIDSMDLQLAKEEPLPEKPHPLPQYASHLLERARVEYVQSRKTKKSRINTTINLQLQQQLNQVLERQKRILNSNEIYNAAVIIIEVESGNVLAYAGNIPDAGADHHQDVDIVKAPRSTGSILKPLLYASMLQEGTILPNSLIPDVPTMLSGYRPQNFHEKYDGVVSARRALIRSLNVPMIYMLQKFGLEKFHFQLKKLHFSTINKPPSHYGLPLIVGGAEATLEDITGTYASMSRMLGHFYDFDGFYDPKDFKKANYLAGISTTPTPRASLRKEAPFLSASACWTTFDAMQEVERPGSEGGWQSFRSSRRIAWKTGTSFGFRDAWAVGVTPEYAVGVWVGNADGEGRPGLVGVLAAAPILFEVFKTLPATSWFEPPYDEMTEIPVCPNSGYRKGINCPTDTLLAPVSCLKAPACPYHQLIHLDKGRELRVNSDCEEPDNMVHQSWFVLPPLQEYYFKNKNPDYRTLPPFRKDCTPNNSGEKDQTMQLIYPKHPAKIYVPVDLDGTLSRTVFTVAHRNPEKEIHWHIDNQYLGSTTDFHTMELKPEKGKHRLVLVDESGNRLEQKFEIVAKED